MLHDVSEIVKVHGGIKWYGAGASDGWVYMNPHFDWSKYYGGKPDIDELLEVVTNFD